MCSPIEGWVAPLEFEALDAGWDLTMSSITDDGQLWGVDSAYNIWYRADDSAEWVKVEGSANSIDVSADGNHVWVCNHENDCFYKNGAVNLDINHWTGSPAQM